jgi:hypothetical protein
MQNFWQMQFPNLGFVGCELSDEDLRPIKDEVEEILSDFKSASPINYALAGHIEKEYKLSKSHSHLEILALKMAYAWKKSHFSNSKKVERRARDENVNNLYLKGSWVNFQKKYEYNPLHRHDGEFVFVAWLDIPYEIENECKVFPNVRDKSDSNGCFTFRYTDVLGRIVPWSIPTDKKYIGKMILFPSELMHEVHPFYTSDDFRISISGNLHLR